MNTSVPRRAILSGLLALAVAQGCATLRASAARPFARLETAVTNDKFDNTLSRSELRVVRDDVVIAPSLAMRLQKGDSIGTGSGTQVMMTFAAGYEVTLDTGTAIYIENPSIFLKWGRAFIKRITGATDTLDTHTRHATLHDVGTSYVVTVTPAVTTVRVESGIVAARARDATAVPWERYGPLEGGVIVAGQRPTRTPAISRDQMDQELGWVRRIDRLSNVIVPQLDSMTETEAHAALDRVGLKWLIVLHRKTGRYAPERVVESTPGAGEKVRPGTYVTLVLEKPGSNESDGVAQCVVPVITDRTRAEAEKVLAGANLRGEVIRRVGERDIVSSQLTKARTRVPCGTIIQFVWGVLR